MTAFGFAKSKRGRKRNIYLISSKYYFNIIKSNRSYTYAIMVEALGKIGAFDQPQSLSLQEGDLEGRAVRAFTEAYKVDCSVDSFGRTVLKIILWFASFVTLGLLPVVGFLGALLVDYCASPPSVGSRGYIYESQHYEKRASSLPSRMKKILLEAGKHYATFFGDRVRNVRGDGNCGPYAFIGALICLIREDPAALEEIAKWLEERDYTFLASRLRSHSDNVLGVLNDHLAVKLLTQAFREIGNVIRSQWAVEAVHTLGDGDVELTEGEYQDNVALIKQCISTTNGVLVEAGGLQLLAQIFGLNAHIIYLKDDVFRPWRGTDGEQPDLVIINTGNHWEFLEPRHAPSMQKRIHHALFEREEKSRGDAVQGKELERLRAIREQELVLAEKSID